MRGNLVQQNIAAKPTGAASSCGERLATLDRGQRKGKMGNKKDGADDPRIEVVVQNKKIRCSVCENGALHFRVRGIDNSPAERF